MSIVNLNEDTSFVGISAFTRGILYTVESSICVISETDNCYEAATYSFAVASLGVIDSCMFFLSVFNSTAQSAKRVIFLYYSLCIPLLSYHLIGILFIFERIKILQPF